MTDGATLLGQCLDAPDDEAPRLVYADWLEEQGNKPAAAIVRNRKGAKTKSFLDGIESWVDAKTPFEGGMLKSIYGKSGSFVTKATQAALLRVLKIFGARYIMVRGSSAKVPACEALAWTTDFTWWDCQADDKVVGALADSPHVARLTKLQLEKLRCSNQALGKLGRSKQLTRVKHLALRAPVYLGTSYDDAGVIFLLERWPLERLDLLGLNHVGLAALGNADAASKLVHLEVTAGREAGGLLKAKKLTGLKTLRLDLFETPKNEDVKTFLGNGAFDKLESLDLSHPTQTPLDGTLVDKLRERFKKNFKYRG
jgi:uncharacterized protein (TIGR02996 family)